jgi:hypothetical protein
MPHDRRCSKSQTYAKRDAPRILDVCASTYGRQQAIKRAQPSPLRHALKALESRVIWGGHGQTRATLKGSSAGCRHHAPEESLTAMFRMGRNVEKQCGTPYTPRRVEGQIAEGLGSDDFIPHHRHRRSRFGQRLIDIPPQPGIVAPGLAAVNGPVQVFQG